MKFIDVYENDYGNVIILPMYAILRVVLAENPATGYRWQVEDTSSSCLEMISNEFLAKNDHAIGATGIVVFYFKPVKLGRCKLYLKLWRLWEGDKSIVKRFRIAVSIISG
ncbi:putative secreted protein [Sporomusaceae bacterium BoRhaA]|uniref:protease inhibitor I42 family protein n=1 Tax=Pelorhabdus rhamnosifermentans TaxID=2772457 RepID=UPI001C062764|nr:protease inhibitor I42 family protein [Pelorhabdus rhamnosifermentans]MBU2703559.1 putative secreted protein [Pelorhabdus rhamnosifermentans]